VIFLQISKQTTIISLNSIDLLVFINESVYCSVRTAYFNIIQVTCFVWISEQTAIISLYSINLLVFVTESVFTARFELNI